MMYPGAFWAYPSQLEITSIDSACSSRPSTPNNTVAGHLLGSKMRLFNNPSTVLFSLTSRISTNISSTLNLQTALQRMTSQNQVVSAHYKISRHSTRNTTMSLWPSHFQCSPSLQRQAVPNVPRFKDACLGTPSRDVEPKRKHEKPRIRMP